MARRVQKQRYHFDNKLPLKQGHFVIFYISQEEEEELLTLVSLSLFEVFFLLLSLSAFKTKGYILVPTLRSCSDLFNWTVNLRKVTGGSAPGEASVVRVLTFASCAVTSPTFTGARLQQNYAAEHWLDKNFICLSGCDRKREMDSDASALGLSNPVLLEV